MINILSLRKLLNMTSKDLFLSLFKLNLIEADRYPHWWVNSGEFSVIIGMILTQQSKWEKVQRSLKNLKDLELLNLEALATKEIWHITQAIVPSGLYNQKASRLQLLCQNILRDFKDLNNFKNKLTREWLLEQKGVGPESADSVLCYFSLQPIMVVDSYTNRLLKAFGFEFNTYLELQEWLINGIETNINELQNITKLNKVEIYMLFHGMIVEYCKLHSNRTKVDIKAINDLI